jgi:exodeoxyribonuclease VII small subunit
VVKASKPDSGTAPDFEKALAELEDIVSTLEKGDLSLEAALKHFERGISLTRQCQTALKEAELKVEKLTEKNGRQELEPFEPEED